MIKILQKHTAKLKCVVYKYIHRSSTLTSQHWKEFDEKSHKDQYIYRTRNRFLTSANKWHRKRLSRYWLRSLISTFATHATKET